MQNDTTGQHDIVLKPSAGADVVLGLCRIEISHLSPQTDRKQHLDGCADIDTSDRERCGDPPKTDQKKRGVLKTFPAL